MRTNPTRCYTLVVIRASASYPFISFAPTVAYHVSFEFLVVGKDLVQISVSGIHDAFPNYEAIVDGTLLYKYDTTWGGPFTGLTLGYLLGQSQIFSRSATIRAETNPCCAVK